MSSNVLNKAPEISTKQRKLDEAYLRVAKIFASLSEAERLKVGSVAVKNRHIIAEGYNGTPTGYHTNCCEIDGETDPMVLHSEQNTLIKIARSGNSSEGATMYITHSPCAMCAKLMIQAGIVRVVFEELYRDDTPIKILRDHGIVVDQISLNSSSEDNDLVGM